jgi:hypothetical protein
MVVRADEEFPSVARRVPALRGIRHHDSFGGSFPERQFLHACVFDFGIAVPDQVEREQQPILIVDERRIDLVLQDRGSLLSWERRYVSFAGWPAS